MRGNRRFDRKRPHTAHPPLPNQETPDWTGRVDTIHTVLELSAGKGESLATGLKHYELCRDHPEQCRRFADGYRKQERVAPKREVPDAEMHRALRSHIKHIESRLFPMLPLLENAFIEAQRDLAAAVRKEYIVLQESVLETGENRD